MFETADNEIRSWDDPSLVRSNASKAVEITLSDLPLHCPMPGTTLWESHPRVFLPIETRGYAKCPYCGTDFKLKREGEPNELRPLSGTRD